MDKAELTSFARAFQKPVPKGQKAPANADNVDKILTAMDFDDADGKIQLEEFETYLEVPLLCVPCRSMLSDGPQAVLAAKFGEYDSNNDGVLRIDEMVGLVADMCDPTSRSRKKDKHFVQKKKKVQAVAAAALCSCGSFTNPLTPPWHTDWLLSPLSSC